MRKRTKPTRQGARTARPPAQLTAAPDSPALIEAGLLHVYRLINGGQMRATLSDLCRLLKLREATGPREPVYVGWVDHTTGKPWTATPKEEPPCDPKPDSPALGHQAPRAGKSSPPASEPKQTPSTRSRLLLTLAP